ncbi:hypothetical protein LCGC14_0622920 [marine sediment metagenome]|uniref:Phage head morphogenesis domain-containing protein n=1 Tax=marine sediment metagenome TaxID=412755 RepID=A0A0F9R4A3_9ZZZZ
MAERAALAAWHGLRRTAEDWHPVIKEKATTVAELKKSERRLEQAIRQWMREVAAHINTFIDVLVIDPTAVDDIDLEQFNPRFSELTRPHIERAMSKGGENSKEELSGQERETGTARSARRRAGRSETGDEDHDARVPTQRLRTRLLHNLRQPFTAQNEPAIISSWTVQSPEAQAWVSNHGLDLATGLNETTVERLQQTLVIGQRDGVGMPEITRRIKNNFKDMSTWRARMIAQTETIRAYAQGSLQVYRDAGVTVKKWLDGQVNACPICVALDGKPISIEGNFKGELPPELAALVRQPTVDGPPAHPGCRCAVRAVIEG